VLAWPAWVLFNTRIIDSSSFVVLANSFLFSILMLIIIRQQGRSIEFDSLAKNGLKVLTISYALAFILPLVFSIDGYRTSELFLPVVRYRGWLGEGQPLAFCGFNMIVWAGLRVTQLKRWDVWSIAAVLFGFTGIFFNVLRIALLAAIAFLLVASVVSERKRDLPRHVFLSFFALAGIFTAQFGWGPFFTKMTHSGYLESAIFQEIEGENGNLRMVEVYPPMPVNASLMNLFTDGKGFDSISKDLKTLDRIIPTNHRSSSYQFLLAHSKETRVFGAGTGFVRRVMRDEHFTVPEVGGDYMRIYIEQGIFGLSLFLLLGCFLFYLYLETPLVAIFASLGVIMLTDVFQIIPTFGYVPLLMAAVAYNFRSRSERQTVRVPRRSKRDKPAFKKANILDSGLTS